MNIKSATYSWNSEECVIKMVKMSTIIAEKHAVTSFTMISILHHSAERQTYCTHAHRLLYNLHIFLINFPLSNALSIPRGLCYLSLPHSNGAKRWHHCSCVSLYWMGYSAKSKCVCVSTKMMEQPHPHQGQSTLLNSPPPVPPSLRVQWRH